jgi:meso-butanediol dehydrogenase / (S,S)-butanediol dehydrogenase / diacetyl reductase
MRLEGKVALVTGATYGIGTTIVERLAQEGASVVFTGRSADKGQKLQDELRSRDLPVSFARGDAAIEDDVRRAVDITVKSYGAITTVVNNAAATDVTRPGGGDSHVADITNEAFDRVWHVGVHGVLWTSKYSIPHMLQAGGGSIINISAASSLRAIEGRPAYQASKGAINALTRQMAVDYGPQGIRSNAIIVGFTPTGGEVITKMVQNESFIAAVKRAIPSPRLGTPLDIANGCVFLASDEGEYVNGVLLPIDGGFTAKLAIPDTSALSVIGEDRVVE